MHLPSPTLPLAWLLVLLIGAWTGAARAQAPTPEPPASSPAAAASAPEQPASAPTLPADTTVPDSTPSDNPLAEIPRRIQTTLDSWQEFLDELLIDALGPNPERRYRVFGKRKTVDLGKRWTLALDERQTGLLNSAGTGIPVAGRPSRTWELTHIGKTTDWRFYNQHDGTGLENGGSVVTTLAPLWTWRTNGRRLHDDTVNVARTDAQTGVRFGQPDLWVEGFVHHARLEDKSTIVNWADRKPYATFGGIETQWEPVRGLSLSAQHQRAIKPEMAPGDEELAGPRTEFGADYRFSGDWAGTRLYWRESTELGLLASPGVEERTTYKRVIGGEIPEGSPDGIVYAQFRQRSLLSDEDALAVLGWRHTMEFGNKWTAQSLIETGIPVAGDNAVKSTMFDVRVQRNDFPRRAFGTELQAVRTPIRNSAFFGIDYTQRLLKNFLFVTRASATGVRPHEDPREVPLNSGEASVGLGWLEPDERRFSTFWRYRYLGREALIDGITAPDVSDRRARIVYSEFDWEKSEKTRLLLRASRRVDNDDAIDGGNERTTQLTVLRPTQQIANRWRMSLHYAHWKDSLFGVKRGYGLEFSVQMNRKIVVALAYNPKGIDDSELAGEERLGKGVQLRAYIPAEAILKHWLRPREEERK